MRYTILLSPEAIEDLRALRANLRAEVRDALEVRLRNRPSTVSKARIKRLEGKGSPQFRLRVGDTRVFYDVVGDEVQVIAIVPKADAEEWLRKVGK